MSKKVEIASGNPVKIESAKEGFSRVFPDVDFDYSGRGVPSDVPDQPMGLEETLLGAQNRIKNLKKEEQNADFYVGIEGGITISGDEYFAFAWIVIESGDGLVGKAQTGHFQLPPPVVDLLKKGYELGHADDLIFAKSNSKQKSGSVGILTDNLIDRSLYYTHAMILALIPFNKRGLFEISV